MYETRKNNTNRKGRKGKGNVELIRLLATINTHSFTLGRKLSNITIQEIHNKTDEAAVTITLPSTSAVTRLISHAHPGCNYLPS